MNQSIANYRLFFIATAIACAIFSYVSPVVSEAPSRPLYSHELSSNLDR